MSDKFKKILKVALVVVIILCLIFISFYVGYGVLISLIIMGVTNSLSGASVILGVLLMQGFAVLMWIAIKKVYQRARYGKKLKNKQATRDNRGVNDEI